MEVASIPGVTDWLTDHSQDGVVLRKRHYSKGTKLRECKGTVRRTVRTPAGVEYMTCSLD